jgi:subtilisin family serine protease
VYADLDGKTSVASIASTMAARKGIFVLNAAGNEGNSSWNFVGIPADADSICTVGSVNGGGIHSSFSSVGPTAHGRIKPDLSSMGEGSYVCSPGFNFGAGNGTSYATPILAGAVACLWQANPTKTNMEILQALKATASKSANPDNDYGWGIPNVCAAHNLINGSNVGISEVEKSTNFKLFPNPANQHLSFSLNQKPQTVEISNVLGKTMKVDFVENSTNQYNIFLNELSAGVYIISIKTNEGDINSKFIKE